MAYTKSHGAMEIFSKMTDEEILLLGTTHPLANRIRVLVLCCENWPYREAPYNILTEPFTRLKEMNLEPGSVNEMVDAGEIEWITEPGPKGLDHPLSQLRTALSGDILEEWPMTSPNPSKSLFVSAKKAA